ncbi:hypothetical protein [Nonomuraea sp. B19D2]|uniref:hypothetical protein n=1 Tax=Nonomuraea sp. B19D2 TaxID=3159561 RepID=UPI0032DBA9DC
MPATYAAAATAIRQAAALAPGFQPVAHLGAGGGTGAAIWGGGRDLAVPAPGHGDRARPGHHRPGPPPGCCVTRRNARTWCPRACAPTRTSSAT